MAIDLDKESSFQEAMVGSAIGSIAQLNERNLRLVKAFLDNQLKITEEEKAESQDSPFFIMYLLSTQINRLIAEKKEKKRELKAQIRELSKEILRLQEIRDDMRWEEINGDV